jgi:hypothetical protein
MTSSSVITRPVLLLIGLAMLLVVGVSLAFLGVSYVNLDNLRAHPLLFNLLFVAAPAIAILSLLLAAVPRVVQINILLFVGLWLCAEFAFGLIDSLVPGIHGDPVGINQQYYLHDPVLGYRPAPNSIARHTEFFGTERVYSVTYLIDRFGRRDTPVSSQHSRDRFLLFLGDSNTFGEGLTETETLPFWAGQFAPAYYPYNYAFSGWGPAQMLDLLKTRDLKSQVRQDEGYAVFFFIPAHIGRVIGSSQVSADWGRDFSYYTIGADGGLTRQGSFATARPLRTVFYDLLNSSNVARCFHVVLPWHYIDDDYRLTAQIMKESQDILEREFRLQGFYVVISPAFDEREVRINRRFMEALGKSGVKYLDFTHLYDTEDVRYRVGQKDLHNSALANRVIAQEIVKNLGIAGSNVTSATAPSPGKDAGASPALIKERTSQR